MQCQSWKTGQCGAPTMTRGQLTWTHRWVKGTSRNWVSSIMGCMSRISAAIEQVRAKPQEEHTHTASCLRRVVSLNTCFMLSSGYCPPVPWFNLLRLTLCCYLLCLLAAGHRPLDACSPAQRSMRGPHPHIRWPPGIHNQGGHRHVRQHERQQCTGHQRTHVAAARHTQRP